MSDLTLEKISYKELRDKSFEFRDDKYGILSYLTENAKEALLACPGNLDDSKTALVIMLDGDVITSGKIALFGTPIMAIM